jgi:hypothetical protein
MFEQKRGFRPGITSCVMEFRKGVKWKSIVNDAGIDIAALGLSNNFCIMPFLDTHRLSEGSLLLVILCCSSRERKPGL